MSLLCYGGGMSWLRLAISTGQGKVTDMSQKRLSALWLLHE